MGKGGGGQMFKYSSSQTVKTIDFKMKLIGQIYEYLRPPNINLPAPLAVGRNKKKKGNVEENKKEKTEEKREE